MTKRSKSDVIAGAASGAALIVAIPKLIMSLPRVLPWIMFMIVVGGIIQIFSGELEPVRGPATPSDISYSATGTLDYLSVRVWNHSSHTVTLAEMMCDGKSVWINDIPPGGYRDYDSYSINISKGPVACEIVGLRSK